MANDTRMAVDSAKNVFEVAVTTHDRPGKMARRERPSRSAFLRFMAQHPKAVVLTHHNLLNNAWQREHRREPALYRALRLLLQVETELSFAGIIG